MIVGGSSKKGMVSISNRIPKKSHKEAKHCALCKKHRGAQNTHNTGDCRKYVKDGTPKRAFAGKSAQQGNPRNRSYPQLSEKIAKLEKSNKKLKRMNTKCKHDRDSDSDDSDSS